MGRRHSWVGTGLLRELGRGPPVSPGHRKAVDSWAGKAGCCSESNGVLQHAGCPDARPALCTGSPCRDSVGRVWCPVGMAVRHGCVPSPNVFGLYPEPVMDTCDVNGWAAHRKEQELVAGASMELGLGLW